MKFEVDEERLRRMLATARGTGAESERLQLLGMQLNSLLADPPAGTDHAGSSLSDETSTARSLGWYNNRETDVVIERALAALQALGWVKEDRLKTNGPRYVKEVATAVAHAVASMPAVQRAMGAAFDSGVDHVQAYGNVVRAIANVFGLDGDALVAELRPKEVTALPIIDPLNRPDRPELN
jgi:hypothetical protein